MDREVEVASDLGATDGSSIAEAAKLAVIGLGMESYPHFDAYMLSFFPDETHAHRDLPRNRPRTDVLLERNASRQMSISGRSCRA